MKIVIDTNIFCQDYHLEKPHFRVLLEGCGVIPATIHIPEVVFDEVINRYREDLEEAVAKYDANCRTLTALTKSSMNTNFDICQLVDVYKNYLTAKIKERGIELVSYPDIPHKKIVERDLARKKPFKRDGSGYRDCLIWENVKRVCMWGDNQVAFITNNPKDFGEGPHIDDDLAGEISNKRYLRVYRSLKDFNDNMITPKLLKLEELRSLLQSEQLEQFDLREWLANNLKDLLRNYDLEEILAGFPHGVGSVWVTEIVEIKDIQITEVSKLEDDNKLLSFSVAFIGKCSISTDGDDFARYPEVREFWGEGDPFSYISTSIDENITVKVDLVINGNTNEVDSEEISTISADYGEIDFG